MKDTSIDERRPETVVADGGGDRSLSVENLTVVNAAGTELLKGISFEVGAGETVALIGESGSGKSLTAKALMGVLPEGLTVTGSGRLGSQDLLHLTARERRTVSGSSLSLLMQDPFTILNPLTTIGTHLAETIATGRPDADDGPMSAQVAECLAQVGLSGVESRYPFELSGGMRQRAALAAAIARDPWMLIADEPTTALDATTQLRLLQLLKRSQQSRGMSLLLITHDLRIALSMGDRVLVMRQGEIVESATSEELSRGAHHEYTRQLLASELPVDQRLVDLRTGWKVGEERLAARPAPAATVHEGDILRVAGLSKSYGGGRRTEPKQALNDVGLTVGNGQSVGIVGGSGSGKTTLARCVLGLVTPDQGSIELVGESHDSLELSDRTRLSRRERGLATRSIQCVFQDPYASLNASHSVGFTLGEAVRQRVRSAGESMGRGQSDEEVAELLRDVQLPSDLAARRPSQLSGGQRQRVAIARALAMRPRLLVCDEPVAALDASVQMEILDVFRRTAARGVSMLFITHDLAVARQVTDALVVVCEGEVVERGRTEDVIDAPVHEYTRSLVDAVPTGAASWLD